LVLLPWADLHRVHHQGGELRLETQGQAREPTTRANDKGGWDASPSRVLRLGGRPRRGGTGQRGGRPRRGGRLRRGGTGQRGGRPRRGGTDQRGGRPRRGGTDPKAGHLHLDKARRLGGRPRRGRSRLPNVLLPGAMVSLRAALHLLDGGELQNLMRRKVLLTNKPTIQRTNPKKPDTPEVAAWRAARLHWGITAAQGSCPRSVTPPL